ncbi:ABC transporter ATP-binding protein [Siccirubricoccus sp. KC 17139]|uniref:ABC transporter ATP-binding protein n=1 Tax=Siccirubricoccus soli TaxID=2899147 RepID=A0ABT1D6A8_9PROT|nr:ABC transporter ATP-binding protein [Siccirubricoccus soli]MCO6417468.1 ABC transporter ATP-binding protein [Siccirubricoccus soli]MCP2683603.1 ABC transporter ATP-binding protein [Siccirubricoccus soli]
MIRLEGLTKTWPGATGAAVADITLEVPEGTSCALIGPSGSGKTTTLRLVNRLVEPSAGRVLIAGKDALRQDPVRLRRHIGYVIQEVGLFPHRSVAENVATVPGLLGWDATRARARVAEVLEMVGLSPARFADRRPHQLSGGERQRVGVARALAGDPPVLLMDEPFGAVDPLRRRQLQDEVLRLLRQLGKTVLVVTHDVAEAMRLGDAVAVLRDGRLVQHAPPAELLARPADGFVAGFLGTDRALTRLGLFPAGAARREEAAPGPPLPPEATLRDALAEMLARGSRAVPLAEGGAVTLDAILDLAA